MLSHAFDTYLRIQELAKADQDTAAIMDYIGVFCALQMRFVEIACNSIALPETK